MKNILASIAAVSVVSGTAVETAQAAAYTVNTDALHVRTGASTSHASLGLVKQGQTLQVTGEEEDWYRITYNGQSAFVSKDFVTVNAPTSANRSHTVLVSSLRIRTGPSTSHSIIGHLDKGQTVQITGEVQDWYKISHNGQTAYISKDYVSSNTTAAPAPSAAIQQNGSYIVNTTSLRIRTGPGLYYPVIGGALEGQALQVIGAENGWYKINRNGTVGYVSSQYVDFTPERTAQPVQEYYIAVPALNVRSGASTQSSILGIVTSGQKIAVSGEQSGWYTITYKGQTAYVAKDFVSNTPQAPKDNAPSAQPAANTSALLSYAKSLVGVPYVWGGTTPSGFDCSGFIYHVYSKFGSAFGRTSVSGYWSGLTRTSNPQPGDLIYFQNTYKPGPSHMGVYLGNGTFVQAGDNGVAISSLDNSYWKSHFLGYTKSY